LSESKKVEFQKTVSLFNALHALHEVVYML